MTAFLAIFGFLTSWIYLRFFKVTFADLSVAQPASLRGDASETFAFAYFVPEPLHQPIAAASDAIYKMLLAMGVCSPFSTDDVETGNSQASLRGEGGQAHFANRGGVGPPAPGSARAEAERRRALALKALDQRLHAASARAPTHPTTISPSSGMVETSVPDSTREGGEAQETGSARVA